MDCADLFANIFATFCSHKPTVFNNGSSWHWCLITLSLHVSGHLLDLVLRSLSLPGRCVAIIQYLGEDGSIEHTPCTTPLHEL